MSEDECWYGDGLRFECTRCGRCCRGSGNVWVSDEEIAALAARFGEDEAEFRRRAVRRSGPRGFTLREKRNQDCIFYDRSSGCTVYDARPRQCRTYPFWRANLIDRETWQDEGSRCPGLGDGPLHSREKIEETASNDGLPDHRAHRGGLARKS